FGNAQPRRNPHGETFVDMDQPGQHGLTHTGNQTLAELEDEGGNDMVLLRLGLAGEEKPRLAVVVRKAFGANTQLVAFLRSREAGVAAVLALMLDVRAQAGGFVIDLSGWHSHLHVTVALEIVKRAFGLVDGNLMKVRTAQPLELGILIRKEPPLQ